MYYVILSYIAPPYTLMLFFLAKMESLYVFAKGTIRYVNNKDVFFVVERNVRVILNMRQKIQQTK